MASHLEIGKAGERLAEEYLVQNGFSILHRNWRCGHEEIDLIVQRFGVALRATMERIGVVA